jgi:hypothetical protein
MRVALKYLSDYPHCIKILPPAAMLFIPFFLKVKEKFKVAVNEIRQYCLAVSPEHSVFSSVD